MNTRMLRQNAAKTFSGGLETPLGKVLGLVESVGLVEHASNWFGLLVVNFWILHQLLVGCARHVEPVITDELFSDLFGLSCVRAEGGWNPC